MWRDRERQKKTNARETIFLPKDSNDVMKEGEGPWARAWPLDYVAQTGREEEKGREGTEW